MQYDTRNNGEIGIKYCVVVYAFSNDKFDSEKLQLKYIYKMRRSSRSVR